MAVYVSNIVINGGTDFDQIFTLENGASNSPLVLTNYTIKAEMRKHASASTATTFTTSIYNELGGQIRIGLSTTQTASLKEGRYVYDVVLTDPESSMSRVVEGMALVRVGVTKF